MPTGNNYDYDLDTLIAHTETTITQLQAKLAQLKATRDADRKAAEDHRANIEARQIRKGFYIVPGLTGTAILGRRVRQALSHPATAAVTSSAVTAVIAITATLILTSPDHQPPPGTQRQTTIAVPAGTSPQTSPPAPPSGTAPSDTAHPEPSGEHPSGAPPSEQPTSPTPVSSGGGPTPTTSRRCRIWFPRIPILRRGLLCSQT